MSQPLPPLPDPARVAVVVPARDAGVTVAIALRTALDQQPPVDEVAVACDPDDSSTRDAVAPFLTADPRVRLVDAPGGRTPDALNAAIAATTAEVVVRLDAHAELPPGYVARAVATLRETGAGNVGGRQVPVAEAGFAGAVAAAMTSPFGAGERPTGRDPRPDRSTRSTSGSSGVGRWRRWAATTRGWTATRTPSSTCA